MEDKGQGLLNDTPIKGRGGKNAVDVAATYVEKGKKRKGNFSKSQNKKGKGNGSVLLSMGNLFPEWKGGKIETPGYREGLS